MKEALCTDGEWRPIGTAVPELAGEYFLVTGSGKFFRNVLRDPEDSICILKVDETGEQYQIQWGLIHGGRPTSELPSHLMKKRTDKRCVSGHLSCAYDKCDRADLCFAAVG